VYQVDTLYQRMKTNTTVDKSIPQHLIDKQYEIIWHLSIQQGYSNADIARIFNFKHRTAVLRIIEKRPADYKPKWVRV